MNKYFNYCLIIFFLSFSQALLAQDYKSAKPVSWRLEADGLKLQALPVNIQPPIPMAQLQREDDAPGNEAKPYRFGYKIAADVSLYSAGIEDSINSKDGRIIRFHIKCPGAKSVNLMYSKFWLPPGALYYMYSPDKKQMSTMYSVANNPANGNIRSNGFATELIYGEEVVLELYESKEAIGKSVIQLSDIVHGYRTVNFSASTARSAGTLESGTCQVNVNCSEGNNWQDEKRGIVRILVNGNGWCSGSLINSTAGNGELYLLTANHCLQDGNGVQLKDAVTDPDASGYTFYWNLERGDCAGSTTNTEQPTTGAVVVANFANSDFALLRLTSSPFMLSTPYKAYFNGWSRTVASTSTGVGIHHPAGDYKKIATHTQAPDTIQSAGGIPGGISHNYWQVKWAATTNGHSVTEGGSSGSPLFNSNSHIIGQLFGGSDINCTDPANDPGVYGKLWVSWNSSVSPQRRLRDWLDPVGISPTSLSGQYPGCQPAFILGDNITTPRFLQAGSITTSNINTITVQPEGVLHLRASDKIILSPGFESKGTLLAYIAPCL